MAKSFAAAGAAGTAEAGGAEPAGCACNATPIQSAGRRRSGFTAA
jgi:hypothetical protein